MTTVQQLTDEDLDDLLELDYRRLLRWYPRSWRAAHGEALLGTLLEEADATDRFMVQPSEWRSFASAGTAARLDRVVARPVRDAASTVLLSMGAGATPVMSVLAGRTIGGVGTDSTGPMFNAASAAGPALAMLWVAGLLAALGGRWWIGRTALLLSVVVAAMTDPLGTALSLPPSGVLESSLLTSSAVAALLASLGTPRTRLPLVAATAGWATLTWAFCSLLQLQSDPTSVVVTLALLGTPSIGFGGIGLTLALVVSMMAAHRSTAAFTILLSAVPLTIALDAVLVGFALQDIVIDDSPIWPVLISLTVVAGLVALVLSSRRRQAHASAARNHGDATTQTLLHRGRRSRRVALALAAVAMIGTAGVAVSNSGRYWFQPSEVDWARWWQMWSTAEATGGGRADAAVTFRLPSGASCTLQFQFDGSGPGHGTGPARDAKDYVQATAANGTLLRDARINDVIRANRTNHSTAPNAWGVQVPYGYGTNSYNPDAEYFEAVLQGTQTAIYRHLAATGSARSGITYSSWNHCTGEQQ